jgi:hypothetical protein
MRAIQEKAKANAAFFQGRVETASVNAKFGPCPSSLSDVKKGCSFLRKSDGP